jgi:hypothetical protein
MVCLILVCVACGGGGSKPVAATGGASSSPSSFVAEYAHMMAAIADKTCGCKDADCASGMGMAAMVLARDIGDVVRKVPAEEPASYGDEQQMLGEVKPMDGLDACWATRADWEMERAGNCYAKKGGEHPAKQAAAPSCGTAARVAMPKLDEWWKRKQPCATGTFEDTRVDSFHIKRCVTDGVTQDGHETKWWLYNEVPAYEQTATGWTYWYPDGKPAAMQTFDKATNTTTLARWYPNGNKRDERTYIGEDGREEAGTRTDYWPNGNKRMERSFRGTHVRTYWYENGTKAAEVGFSDEAHHGPFTLFHPNGKVKKTGTYMFGQEHGIFEEFDENGASIKREQFNYGRAGEPPVNYGKPKVTAASLLTEDLVKPLGGYTGAVVAEETDPTDAYSDNIRYRAPNKPASFDVGLRVYGSGGTTTPRGWLDQMRVDYPKGTDVKLADVAFFVDSPKAVFVIFHDKRGLTALLECGKDRCATSADAVKLATALHKKLPARF